MQGVETAETPGFTELKGVIDEWVDSKLSLMHLLSPLPSASDTKIIREPIYGYQILSPMECLVLDTPILQRLRYIHQTAFAYLVYPGANHTRYDHSLGVAYIAQQIGVKLKCNEDQIRELRLAALLHDVGHCLFSHLSENLMQQHFEPMYLSARTAGAFAGKSLSLGEILSYLIVRSPRFDTLLRTLAAKYSPGVDVDNIAKLIIGNPSPDFGYLGDIIHGPFDADKLDYLVRDCYFSGIRADVDVPRVIASATNLDRERFKISEYPISNLVMNNSGVSNLEQVTFNKMLLYPAIYHHHKIRAIECMIRGVFEFLWDSPGDIKVFPQLRFSSVRDFLDTSEQDFFSLGEREPAIQTRISRLRNRQLLKRCLVISMDYLENPRARKDDLFKVSTEGDPGQIRRMRELMWDYLPKNLRGDFHEFWIDLPKLPAVGKDADQCMVDNGTSKATYLKDYFPYPRWVESYQERRWKGHIFYSSDPKFRWAANRSGKRILKEQYRVRKLNPCASSDCKIPLMS